MEVVPWKAVHGVSAKPGGVSLMWLIYPDKINNAI
jgi:hypothetical protein